VLHAEWMSFLSLRTVFAGAALFRDPQVGCDAGDEPVLSTPPAR
jgi:hypothetical protein